jgi:hypothetical protein
VDWQAQRLDAGLRGGGQNSDFIPISWNRTHYEGLPVTTVSRILVAVATAGLAWEQVRQAIRETLCRGLVSRGSLLRRAAAQVGCIKRLVEEVLHGE